MKLSTAQLELLEHLCVIAVNQKTEARETHKKFKQGWTHVNETMRKSPTLARLVREGLAESRCYFVGDPGSIQVRITRAGVIHLEEALGEGTIYA